MMKMFEKKRKGGFTLIELIVVIAILGILAAILIPRFGGFTDRARETQALVEAKQVATAIDAFEVENGTWPVEGTDNAEIATLSGVATGGVEGADAAASTSGFILRAGGAFTVVSVQGDNVYTAGRIADGEVVAPDPN